jgi:hypothetical protein
MDRVIELKSKLFDIETNIKEKEKQILLNEIKITKIQLSIIKMPLNCYIAGSWANRSYIKKEWIDKLKTTYNITHDWTSSENGDRSIERNQICAQQDVNGVEKADFMIVIMNEQQSLQHAYRGTFFEMGHAYGKIPIYVYCPFELTDNINILPGLGENVFLHLPKIQIYDKPEELLANLPT